MAKFIFLSIPLRSHANPTFPVVRELVARGEEVIYYLTEQFKEEIEATGATFRGYASSIEQINQSAAASGKLVGLPMYMLDEALFVIPQILESIRAEQPDCLVYETMCLSGKLIAEILHIPAVNFRMIFAFSKRLTQIFQANASHDPAGIAAFQKSLAQAQALYNVQPFHLGSIFTHEAELNIVTIPRAFQVDSDEFGANYRFVGSAIAPRKEEVEFPFEELENQSVIYISHGTVYNNKPGFFNQCFAAFADTPWKVVLSIGTNVDREKLDAAPANFIVRAYVPQLEILKYASVCVTHGSMTTLMEAFAQGVPVVVIPQSTSDVTVNALRVKELGLGLMLDEKSFTPEELRAAVGNISSDLAFYTRTQQMREEIDQAGGYTKAADALQDFARIHV
ncbi:MAG TPA: macrolide family glycosyltransferase [Ktedonobacteraceae bacterium]|nr:macrolide family glycosyltransferase [Ktedonobacteraceae bacterium]